MLRLASTMHVASIGYNAHCTFQTGHKHTKHFPIRYSLLLIIRFYLFFVLLFGFCHRRRRPRIRSILSDLCCCFPIRYVMVRVVSVVASYIFFYIDVYMSQTHAVLRIDAMSFCLAHIWFSGPLEQENPISHKKSIP